MELGHPHGDRPQGLEEDLAADFASAGFVIGQKPGLVPCTYLSHFDSCAIFLGEIAHQVAKIDPFLRSEIKEQTLSAEQMFTLDDLQRQLVLL